MIVPWLRGILSWNHAPLTWCLVGLNLLFYFLTVQVPQELTKLGRTDLEWAGRAYAEMRGSEAPVEPGELLLLGSQAIRDENFFRNLEGIRGPADEIGARRWKDRLVEFRSQLKKRPANIFGLQAAEMRPLSLITYQFMHSGGWHIVGNMLMLVLFGVALEALTGSFLVVGVYLLGGLAGALTFLWLTPGPSAPMIGASASLSAVMTFYAMMEKRKRVKFFIFAAPSPGYWGEIHLPTLLILPLFFVQDLASFMATAEEVGAGVAYAAHLGGAAFGLAAGLILRRASQASPRWEQILYASYSRSRTEAP